jgi:transcription initiation factor TFIIH subunit 2
MGFPTRTSSDVPTLVHATRDAKLLARTAFVCPQCQAKASELPTDCTVCGLQLVLAPHLARSFHHLFPVPPFSEISLEKSFTATNDVVSSSTGPIEAVQLDSQLVVSSSDFDRCCFGCLKLIGTTIEPLDIKKGKAAKGEEILRFQCPRCNNVFCADCDAYVHETLHNCPGCLST